MINVIDIIKVATYESTNKQSRLFFIVWDTGTNISSLHGIHVRALEK